MFPPPTHSHTRKGPVFVESVVDDVFCEMGKAILDLRMPSLCHGPRAKPSRLVSGRRSITATTAPATAAAAITTIIAITSATDRIAPLPAALLAGLLLVCGLANRVIICCLTNARRGGPRRVKQLVKHTAMARSDERDVSIRPGRSSHHQTMIADLCHELP